MKKQLVRNLGIKLSSLALALVLWFSLYGGREGSAFIREGEIELVVPVKVLGPPLPLFWIEVKPKQVELVLAGHQDALKKLTAREVNLFVLIEGLGKGKYELYPRAYLPEGIRVIERRPRTIKVILSDKWTIE